MAIHPPQIPGLTDWRPLARGGFAVVWEARQTSLDRLVAVKVDQRRLDGEVDRLRFLREAGAAGRMSGHPGIVTVHDAGILDDHRPYLVMELCPGGSLTAYLDPAARPSAARVRDIGVRIADALAASHARGVLHRDVKPANILIDSYDQPGLADFGLAAITGPDLTASDTSREVTPAYTAPEVLRGQPPTQYADVYSLAATLYALLDGRPPHWPATGTPTLAEVLELSQEPVAQLPHVSPGLQQVLAQALALDPTARPTAAAFRDRLARLDLVPSRPRSGDAVAVHARTAGSTALRRLRRVEPRRAAPPPPRSARPGRAALLGLVAVVAVAGLAAAAALLARGGGPVGEPGVAATAPASAVASPSDASTSRTTASPTTASPTTASPTPPAGATSGGTAPARATPAVVPAGFTPCEDQLGPGVWCPVRDECWSGVISVFDLPSLGTPRGCGRTHVYQTFAAAPLAFDVRRQSQLEGDRQVRRLCSRDQLDEVLPAAEREVDWEVLVLPPQEDDGTDRYFRCLFGAGDRSSPVPLRTPR